MVADLEAAREFAAQWAGKGYEKGECQKFWTLLLRDVLGYERMDSVLFEHRVAGGGFIDVWFLEDLKANLHAIDDANQKQLRNLSDRINVQTQVISEAPYPKKHCKNSLFAFKINGDLTREDLCRRTGLFPVSLAKLGRGGNVAAAVFARIFAERDSEVAGFSAVVHSKEGKSHV